MNGLDERIVRELKAERDLVPHANPGPTPEASPQWFRYVPAAAALLVVVVGGLWLNSRLAGPPTASSVVMTSVTGDANADVVDLWENWWTAWTEFRETATWESEGIKFSFDPFEDLVTDQEVVLSGAVADILHELEADSGPVGLGEPTQIRLAPAIQIQGEHATIRDCAFLDPIPWPGLRSSSPTAGTVRYTAEMQLTPDGWRLSKVNPEPTLEQQAADPCQP